MLPLFNKTTQLDKIPIRVSTESARNEKGPLHFHRHVQLCFVLSGELKHIICGKEYIQRAGSCAFLLPFMPHISDASESEDTPIITHIWFHESFFKKHGYNLLSYGESANFNGFKIPLISDFPGHGDLPIRILREIINEFEKEKNLSFKKLSQLTAKLFSLACTEPIEKKADPFFEKQLLGVNAAFDYLEKHFHKKISLDNLCEVAEMSRRSFTSHFKRITHLTPLQAMLSIRIQTAFKLIMETDMLFDEIAQRTGLGDHTNMARVFVKNVEMSPSEFVEDYVKKIDPSYTVSTYSRYKWLFELKSPFNDEQ